MSYAQIKLIPQFKNKRTQGSEFSRRAGNRQSSRNDGSNRDSANRATMCKSFSRTCRLTRSSH